MMIYFPDGTQEMVIKEGQCWEIIEDKLGYDFRNYMAEELNGALEKRFEKPMDRLSRAYGKLEDLMELIEPLTKKGGALGKTFGKIHEYLNDVYECIESCLDVMNYCGVEDGDKGWFSLYHT